MGLSQTIYEKINLKGKLEIEKINSNKEIEIKKLQKEIVGKATKDQLARVDKATSDAAKLINHKERLVDLEKRQALLTSKQEILDDIFNEVLNRLNLLEGKELLTFVTNLIKKENDFGDEVIYVSEKNYDKYLKALSTNKKADLVELDLLNKKLKANFKLSNEAVSVDEGFLITGKDFDLNFTFSDIVLNTRKVQEKAIADKLF